MNELKVLACGQVEREDNVLQEVQLRILNTGTKNQFNVICSLEDDEEDCYLVQVKNVTTDEVIDECRVDSSGGVLMDEDFLAVEPLNQELCDKILTLLTEYFIVEF